VRKGEGGEGRGNARGSGKGCERKGIGRGKSKFSSHNRLSHSLVENRNRRGTRKLTSLIGLCLGGRLGVNFERLRRCSLTPLESSDLSSGRLEIFFISGRSSRKF
jgi:hypothetical protein